MEEFKKELSREVLLMTNEVSRLQRERQSLEHQIAELFAFYAKQKKQPLAEDVSVVLSIGVALFLTGYSVADPVLQRPHSLALGHPQMDMDK